MPAKKPAPKAPANAPAAKAPAKAPAAKPAAKGATPSKVARVQAARSRGIMPDEYAKRERAFQLEPEAGVREKRMRDRALRTMRVLKPQYVRESAAEAADRIKRGLSEFTGTKASDKLRKLKESSGLDYNLREASKLKMKREAAGRAAVKAGDAKLTKAAKKVYRPSGGGGAGGMGPGRGVVKQPRP